MNTTDSIKQVENGLGTYTDRIKRFFPWKDYKGFCKFVCLQTAKHVCPMALQVQQFLKEKFKQSGLPPARKDVELNSIILQKPSPPIRLALE